MRVKGKVKYRKPEKDEISEAKEFPNQYMKNVTENQIKVMCSQCSMNTTIYPFGGQLIGLYYEMKEYSNTYD